MEIKKARKEDLKKIGKLVHKTFKKNVKEGTKKGIKDYLRNVRKNYGSNDSKKIKEYFSKNPLFYVAEENGKIIGVLRGRLGHIGHFFVDPKYQGKGIGWKLYKRYEKDAKKKGAKIIKINSSIYAVPFYKRQGYQKVGKVVVMHGIKIQKLRKRLR